MHCSKSAFLAHRCLMKLRLLNENQLPSSLKKTFKSFNDKKVSSPFVNDTKS